MKRKEYDVNWLHLLLCLLYLYSFICLSTFEWHSNLLFWRYISMQWLNAPFTICPSGFLFSFLYLAYHIRTSRLYLDFLEIGSERNFAMKYCSYRVISISVFLSRLSLVFVILQDGGGFGLILYKDINMKLFSWVVLKVDFFSTSHYLREKICCLRL